MNKLADAIDGIYSANPTQDDKDIAFLIQQFGGPGLLDMVARAIKLPSNSTVYQLLQGISTVSLLHHKKLSKTSNLTTIFQNIHTCLKSPRLI